MAKLKIQKTHTGGDGAEASAAITSDSYVSPTTINSTHIGGVGGNNSQTIPTIRTYYLRNTGGATDTGYVIFQKGMRKFQVNNTSNANSTVMTLVNKLSTELTTANTGIIRANTQIITGANLANIGTGGGSYTDNRAYAYVTFAAANVAGNSQPTIGYQITAGAGGLGTGFLTGNVTVVAINSATNITVSCASQTVTTNALGRMQLTTSFAASRISNKYVWDWDSSKWRYYFGNPYTDGSTILSSQPTWQNVILARVDNN